MLTNPLAGIADATAKTAEGIKNTAMTNMKPNDNRFRNPRIFYGLMQSYREFQKDEASLNEIIFGFDKKFQNLCYEGIFLVSLYPLQSELVQNTLHIVVTREYIIAYNSDNNRIEWYHPSDMLATIIIENEAVQLIFYEENNLNLTYGSRSESPIKYMLYTKEVSMMHRILGYNMNMILALK